MVSHHHHQLQNNNLRDSEKFENNLTKIQKFENNLKEVRKFEGKELLTAIIVGAQIIICSVLITSEVIVLILCLITY